MIYERFGIPTVSAVQWASSRLLAMLLDPKVRSDFAFGAGEVVLVELEAPEELDGKRVLDIELPRVLSVVAVERDGKAILLSDTDVVHTGDQIYMAIDRDSAPELRKLLGLA